jgi:hypothetical protein
MANDQSDESRKRESRRNRTDEDDDLGGTPSVTDTIKKIVTAGVSAAFMTEESIRSFVSELKLPKETLNLLLQSAAKSKEELMNRVSREIIGIISKIDFVNEASRFVEEHKFRVSAEIEVIRKDNGLSVGKVASTGAADASVEVKVQSSKGTRS